MTPRDNRPLCTVVGFGAGNGYGIARAFGQAGFQLALVSRSPERQAEPLAKLHALGIAFESFAADAGQDESLRNVFTEISTQVGETDVLLYNTMAANFGKPTSMTSESGVSDYRINVLGALAATKAVLPGMRARRDGTIFFTGGGWASYPSVDATSASMGKAALRILALMLADELKGTGVRVGTLTIMGQVLPGTPFDPERIGNAFVDYHHRSGAEFTPEVIFDGV